MKTTSKTYTTHLSRILPALALLALSALPASAQSGSTTWSGNTSTDFYDGSNWTNGQYPNGNTTFVDSALTGAANTTVDRASGGNYIFGLYFNNTLGTQNSYTINGPQGFAIGGSVIRTAEVTSGSLTDVINADIADTGQADVWDIRANHHLDMNGVYSGGNTTTKTGAGTLTFAGANTYTGATTITAGTLEIGGAGSLGSGSYAGTIANSGTFEYNSSANQTLSGVISGTGSVVKGNTGTLTLTGANTYSGVTTINAGILEIQSDDALGSTVGETIINGGAKLTISGGITTAENITNVGGGQGKITGGTGGGTFTGLITLTNSIDLRGNDLTFSGGVTALEQGLSINVARAVIDTTAIDLDSDDSGAAGTLSLTSASNSLANATQLNVGGNDWDFARINFGGYLLIGGDNYMPVDAGVEFGWSTDGQSQATLDLGGNNQEVAFLRQTSFYGGVNGDQNITNSGSTDSSLTINTAAGTYDFHGRITDGATNSMSIVKDGVGTQIFDNNSGIASSYSGTTTVNGGVLQIGDNDGTGDTASTLIGDIVINSGGTLRMATDAFNQFSSTGAPTVTINDGGVMETVSTNNNAHNLYGALILNGGTLTSSGGTYGGGNWIFNDGVTVGGSTVSTISATSIGIRNNSAFNVADATGDASTDLLVSSIIEDTGGGTNNLTKTGAGTMELTGANTYTGDTTISAGTLKLSGGGLLGSGGTYSGTLSIDGTSAFVWDGDNLQVLTAPSREAAPAASLRQVRASFGWISEQLSITAGRSQLTEVAFSSVTPLIDTVVSLPIILNIEGGGALAIQSSVGGNNRTVLNNKTWNFDNGGGTLTFNGGNHLFQGGGSTHNFDVTAAGSGSSITSINGGFMNMQGSGNIEFDVADGAEDRDLTLSATLNNGLITKDGAGTLAITGPTEVAYAIDINAGTLEVGDAATLAGGTFTAAIANDGTYKHNSSANQTISGVISGTGAVVKDNSSTLTLSGDNTYSGNTTRERRHISALPRFTQQHHLQFFHHRCCRWCDTRCQWVDQRI